MQKTVMSFRIRPLLQRCDLDEVCTQLLPGLVSCFRRHQQHKRIFFLRFQILRWVSPLLFICILQGIAAGIGTSNFLRAAFIVSLNSSSFGSMKNVPLNCLALSSFGFSIAHLCFAFFFCKLDICFHMSGHALSGLEIVCVLVSLHPDQVYPSGCLSFNKINLVKLVHASDNSFFHPRSSNHQYVFPTIRPVMYVVLVTSMYFNGIGNDSCLGTCSSTLGST